MWVHICPCVYTRVCVHVYVSACTYARALIHDVVCACVQGRMCACLCTHESVSVCVCGFQRYRVRLQPQKAQSVLQQGSSHRRNHRPLPKSVRKGLFSGTLKQLKVCEEFV